MLSPIRPSAPIRVKYEARLHVLIDEMHASLIYWITAEWRKNSPETVIQAADESPVKALQATLSKLGRQWLGRFDDLADSLAEYFAKSVKDRCDRTLADALRKGGFTVRFRMSKAMRQSYGAVRAENVALIRSVAEQHLGRVETLVMQSVSQGRDLGTLTKALVRQTGISKRKAAFIALDQNNKATATLRSVREQEIGVTEGVWLHSAGGKHPRPAHKAFSGQRFKLTDGHDFGDGFGQVLPGQAINCRCTWKAVVPGFD